MPPSGANKGGKQRPFKDLHPKDQQIKQTKKLCIEKNWQMPIERCLPRAIRPRRERKRGAKIRVDDPDTGDESWWNWSVELLKSLEELSAMTEGNPELAGRLLEIEVENRQNNPKSSQRKIMEVLLGDAQKVVDEQRKRLAIQYTADGLEFTDETYTQYDHMGIPRSTPNRSGPMHASSNALMRTYKHDRHGKRARVDDYDDYPSHRSLSGTYAEEDEELSGLNVRDSFGESGSSTAAMGLAQLRGHAKVTELRARAARLRAKAARIEAEALDAAAEAKELQEALEEDDVSEQQYGEDEEEQDD